MSRFLGKGTLFRRITVATLRSFMCFFANVPCAFPIDRAPDKRKTSKASVSVLAQPVVTFRSTDFKVIGILKSAGAPICTVK